MEHKMENRYMEIYLENNILYSAFKQGTEMDINVAKFCVTERIKFSNNTSYRMLIEIRGLKSVTKEAREYMAEEGAALVLAAAFIISSPLSKLLGNIFLAINRPKIPSKLFTDRSEAIKWLEQFA
jgi:hypothetical protein